MSTAIMFVGGPADGWHDVVNVQKFVIVRVETHGPWISTISNAAVDHIYNLEHYRLPPDAFTDTREVPVYVHNSLSIEQALPLIERRLGV
jgi:hypothetical protein